MEIPEYDQRTLEDEQPSYKPITHSIINKFNYIFNLESMTALQLNCFVDYKGYRLVFTRLSVPYKVRFGVITVELVVEESPVGFALYPLASLPQHDGFHFRL